MSTEMFETVVSTMELFPEKELKDYKRAVFSGDYYHLAVASVTVVDEHNMQILAQDHGSHIDILVNGCFGTLASLRELKRCTGEDWYEDDLDMLKDALVDPTNALEKWHLEDNEPCEEEEEEDCEEEEEDDCEEEECEEDIYVLLYDLGSADAVGVYSSAHEAWEALPELMKNGDHSSSYEDYVGYFIKIGQSYNFGSYDGDICFTWDGPD